jgi:hypothetical protein
LRTNTEFYIAARIDLGGIIDWLYDEGKEGKFSPGHECQAARGMGAHSMKYEPRAT